jgi:hypothetical protein
MFLNGYQDGEIHTIIGWYSQLEENLTRLPDAQIQDFKIDGEIPFWEGQALAGESQLPLIPTLKSHSLMSLKLHFSMAMSLPGSLNRMLSLNRTVL